ncbi:hypothetical protein PFISCL1PPCAC_23369, partial [Pristionchus fissidentatus]
RSINEEGDKGKMEEERMMAIEEKLAALRIECENVTKLEERIEKAEKAIEDLGKAVSPPWGEGATADAEKPPWKEAAAPAAPSADGVPEWESKFIAFFLKAIDCLKLTQSPFSCIKATEIREIEKELTVRIKNPQASIDLSRKLIKLINAKEFYYCDACDQLLRNHKVLL